jgi:PKD repeat protein
LILAKGKFEMIRKHLRFAQAGGLVLLVIVGLSISALGDYRVEAKRLTEVITIQEKQEGFATSRVDNCEKREPYLVYQPTIVVKPNEHFSVPIFVNFSDCPDAGGTYHIDFNEDAIYEISGQVDRDSFLVEGRFQKEGNHPIKGKVVGVYGTTGFVLDVYVTRDKITSEEARTRIHTISHERGLERTETYSLGDGIRNRRAVLLMGSSAERFWVDINLAYHVLGEKYGFTDEEIILLTPDSNVPSSLTDFDAVWIDGTSDVTTLQNTFADLSDELDGDDLLLFAFDGHGSGYYGPRTRRPYFNGKVPNSVYEGPINESEFDDPDYREDEFQTEFIQSGRVNCAKHDGVSKGLGKFLPCFDYYVSHMSAGDSYYRFKLASHFQNLPLTDGSTASDDDIYIEKIISYAKCDINRNTIIEEDEINLCDWDGDGITLFDACPTGEFDEDDWFGAYGLEEGYHPYYWINGLYYCLVDKNLDNTLDMIGFESDSDPLYLDCLSQQADPGALNPLGSDANNDGYSDYLDINRDNDLYDVLSFDETLHNIGYDDEIADLFSMIDSDTTKVFLTQSCFGGGFLRDLSDQHIISMSASEEDDTSSGNYFIRYFFMALNGGCEQFGSPTVYPGYDCESPFYDNIEVDLDLDNDGLVSIAEAFRRSYYKATSISGNNDYPMLDDNADLLGSYGDVLTYVYELPYFVDLEVPEGIYGDSTFLDEQFFGDLNQVSCYDFDNPLNFTTLTKTIHSGEYDYDHIEENYIVDYVCDGTTSRDFASKMLEVSKEALVDSGWVGEPLTYTIQVTNTSDADLHAIVTDTLPERTTPTGVITWPPIITAPDGVWTETVIVTPDLGYAGLLTNVIQVATDEGATGAATSTVAIANADFTGAPATGVAPLTVDFTNQSTGDYDTCVWDFGDGDTSSDCGDPSHDYTSSGLYTVTLTVSGLGGADALTRTNYITAYEAVNADFTGAPTNGVAPLTVDFTNQPTGDYDTCVWDFGDGDTSSDCGDPSHDYTSSGLYTVTLTVSGFGGTDTLTRTNYLTVYEPVQADFIASPTSGAAPLSSDFTNLSTGDYDTCAWEFGDGYTSSDCSDPSHDYTSAGIYTVTLTISGLGGSDTLTRASYVTVYEPVQADFKASPTDGFAPVTIVFTNTSTGDYMSSLWDLGDGMSSTLEVSTHTYEIPGAYTVTLIIDGPGGSDALSRADYIAVYEPIQASFTTNSRKGVVPLIVHFTDTTSGPAAAWIWGFGDGETSTLQHPTHIYTPTGIYTVSLTAQAAGGSALWSGGADTLTRTDYITVEAHCVYLPLILRN